MIKQLVKVGIVVGITTLITVVTVAPGRAAVSTFFGEPIALPASGPGVPFPSNIPVSGLSGGVTHVTVTLFGVTHNAPRDLDVLLRSPGGQFVMLMSDAGFTGSINNVNLRFDDCASKLPPKFSQIVSGTYKPSNYNSDNLSGPMEDPASTLAVINGEEPNGEWNLFVIDDASVTDAGSIAGGWSLTIFTSTSLPANQKPAPCEKPDFDGDGIADISVFRDGVWFILRSSDGGQTVISWGTAGDVPVPGDYDGDAISDVAVYRGGNWFIRRSSDGGQTYIGFGGAAEDIPVPRDYDGDGLTDVAVFRDGVWFIKRTSDGQTAVINWGLPQDEPVP